MSTDAARVLDLDPRQAARVLAQAKDEAWLEELQASLDRQLARSDLDRVLAVWHLSQSEAARRFGVTRQAVGKWLAAGVPASRVEEVADLAAATDLLVRHLKRNRIPAVVRRPAERLGGRSLFDLVAAGQHREVLRACREMFAFGDLHA